jgi:hypothetical protein
VLILDEDSHVDEILIGIHIVDFLRMRTSLIAGATPHSGEIQHDQGSIVGIHIKFVTIVIDSNNVTGMVPFTGATHLPINRRIILGRQILNVLGRVASIVIIDDGGPTRRAGNDKSQEGKK